MAAPFIIKKLLRGRSSLKFIGFFLLAIVLLVWALSQYKISPPFQQAENEQSHSIEFSDVHSLYKEKRSGEMVSIKGYVTRILPDDKEGSRHQRFLVNISRGLSLLIAHNIDLAPRVPVHINDQILVYGQYEWNEKGGLIHWTHHDPAGLHSGGWISHKDKKYQ